MDALDLTIESAVASGLSAQGMPFSLVHAKTHGSAAALIAFRGNRANVPVRPHGARWTPEEDRFLRANVITMSDREIGNRLGRTRLAVHLRRERDLQLPARSKREEQLTGEQIAQGLGCDGKQIAHLIDRGILSGWRMPTDDETCVIRIIDRNAFLRWIVNPMHWIYFKPERVGLRKRKRGCKKYDKEFWRYVRRLLIIQRERWADQWWSIGKVARYHGINDGVINRAIHAGKLPAVDWGNWWILKSDAVKIKLYPGKGKPGWAKYPWSHAGDAFLVLARACGIEFKTIARMMKERQKRIEFRMTCLRRDKQIPAIIKRHGLKIQYDLRTGRLSADKHAYARRFKLSVEP